MCGIAGRFLVPPRPGAGQDPVLGRMGERLSRRGPDDAATWTDPAGRCRLAFRRLAILDLSESGRQPMTRDGRFAIAVNGEVYDFREIRADLVSRGAAFRSTGDAEVALEALALWGRGALSRFDGMFALAFFDAAEGRLLLARDAFGVKPLFWTRTDDGFAFASQVDALLAVPEVARRPVDPEALSLFLRLGHVPAPRTILAGVRAVEPGAWVEIDAQGRVRTGRHFEMPVTATPDLAGDAAFSAVADAVSRSVRRQLVSDVPLGTFLSGGIDSPLVAAEAGAAAGKGLVSFTLATPGDPLDESDDAAAYARAFGLEHVRIPLDGEGALALVDDAVLACGEPFADPSILPTMAVARRARERVKALLSGDGGDELFFGYADRAAPLLAKSPSFAAPPLVRRLRRVADRLANGRRADPDLRRASLGECLRARHERWPDRRLRAVFPDVSPWPADVALFRHRGGDPDADAAWIRWSETVGHLPMVLAKVDRASMFFGLEVRVPLLGRSVVETALRVDWRTCLDVEARVGKRPLRAALARHGVAPTPGKRGFSVPIGAWLRGPLKARFEDAVLSRGDLAGLPLDRRALRAEFDAHLAGKDRASALWTLLSLALWEERVLRPARSAGGAAAG